jgi:alpha/beta superfamily hydrolase
MVNGERDRVVPVNAVKSLVDKLKTQKGIVVNHEVVPGANHFFEDKVDDLVAAVERYLEKRSVAAPKPSRAERAPQEPEEDD